VCSLNLLHVPEDLNRRQFPAACTEAVNRFCSCAALLLNSHLPPMLQCNMAFDRVSLKGSSRKGGGGGMGSTIGLPLGMMGGMGGPGGYL
jgi:hypothetical protein